MKIYFSLPGEGLSADGVGANNLDGQDALVVKEFSCRLCGLVGGVLGSLCADELVSLLDNFGGDSTTVGGALVELLAQLEFQGHRLQHGGGSNRPLLPLLFHLKRKQN